MWMNDSMTLDKEDEVEVRYDDDDPSLTFTLEFVDRDPATSLRRKSFRMYMPTEIAQKVAVALEQALMDQRLEKSGIRTEED